MEIFRSLLLEEFDFLNNQVNMVICYNLTVLLLLLCALDNFLSIRVRKETWYNLLFLLMDVHYLNILVKMGTSCNR